MSEFLWATVTAIGPLRIKLDGDTAQLPFTPETLIDPAALAVDARVRCELSENRVLVVGRSGGDSAAVAALINTAVPVGKIEWYAGTTAPSATWLVCDGSAVSRSTYAALFTLIGTTYGAGNGTTTFNLPDLRERAAMGANAATSIGTATFTNATDIVNRTAHGLSDGDRVYFTGGTMPTGLTASTRYFVVNATANTFQVATTRAGTAINFTTDGSGTRTLFVENFALGLAQGEKAHKLTAAELAAHAHGPGAGTQFQTAGAGASRQTLSASGSWWVLTSTTLADINGAALTASAGGDQPHNILPPYLALTPMIKALAAV